ncbi:hypothetical protein BN7_4290 [Wickerhamomyces ciferrii]|uniref:Uncharacterized protein n=1 Tax=Wickerhamomyces ciferrii (strain ATCC 14091 / BCRC 22168 / CBS 111 / JCM 3599 / NBRC 0793 / NRRL Y-1031 F-60-10) TaxID=1206466 RepID=K0KRT7_WICCF|nr:uncharacterized protein BN7_4290 [Wickerhamomyces ciferrii]CCH44722.1 hypothetical protein BN7_4290 [Wickerhamomyces ciferrii]
MIITPFGSQFDGEKQTQHHQNNNNNKFYNGGVVNGGGHLNNHHHIHHQKNQMRTNNHHGHHQHNQKYQHPQVATGGNAVVGNLHVNGNGINTVSGVNNVNSRIGGQTHGLANVQVPTPAPTPMVAQQQKGFQGAQVVPAYASTVPNQVQFQQQVQQQAQILGNKALLQHPQPQFYQQGFQQQPKAHQLTPTSSSSSNGYPSVVAASPDNFVEELVSNSRFDPFNANSTTLSSSVSSNGGSTSSYGSNYNDDLLNKDLFNATNANTNVNVNLPNEFQNKVNPTNNNLTFNDNNNNGFNNNNNNRSDKNFGWLNIWGNDMSVWG